MTTYTPPHSIDAEQSVLGTLLLDDREFPKVKSCVDSGDFYSPEHNIIFSEMSRMQARGEALDVVTVAESLENSGVLDKIGGMAYLGELADMTPTTKNAESYAKIVKDRSFSRQVMAANIEFAESLKTSDNTLQSTMAFREDLASLINPFHNNSSDLFSKIVFDAREAIDMEEPDYWIEDRIPKESMVMIFGPSGEFKSFIAMDMACSIAAGIDYHGNEVEKAPVLYITGEGQRSINHRKRAWELKHNVYASQMGVLGQAIDMTDSAASVSLVLAIEQYEHKFGVKPSAIFVDTVNRSFGDGDENSSQDMTRFVKSCDQIKAATGVTIILIHHSGKDVSKGARGSSVLKAALDAEYSVARVGEDRRGRVVTLSCSKIKDGQEPPDLVFNMESVLIGKKNKKGHELDSLVPEILKTEVDNYINGDNTMLEDIVKDIISDLKPRAKKGIVLMRFKEQLPPSIEKSKAADILSAIVSGSGFYDDGNYYHLT